MPIKTNTKINKQSRFMISYNDIFQSSFNRINADHNGSSVIIPHVCNNIDLFGAGFASAVARVFPSAKADYHMLGKKFLKENLGYCQIIKVDENSKYKHKLYIANMIAQNGIISNDNPRPINYFALVKSMYNLSNFINEKMKQNAEIGNSSNIEIHCPKFGSGLAGGNWYFISDLIEDIWSSKFHVTIYDLKK